MLDQLADRLTEARKNAKLTQEQAGKAIGRSHAALSAYEAGRALPPIPVLDQLCQLYRVRISAVLGQDQPPGFPHVQPGGYAVADPNNPTRLTFWNKSPRPAEPPDPWPRRSPHPSPIINGDTAESRESRDARREYMRAVMLEIADDPVRARAVFAAFQNRCAACCQPLDNKAHERDGLHSACAGRIGRERAGAYISHIQMARALAAAGELDAGSPPVPQPPSRRPNMRAEYTR